MSQAALGRERHAGFQEAGVKTDGAKKLLKRRELERYKSVGNISDEDMEKLAEKQEVVVGREGDGEGTGGEGHAQGWGDMVEDGLPIRGWQERLAAAMGNAHQPGGG